MKNKNMMFKPSNSVFQILSSFSNHLSTALFSHAAFGLENNACTVLMEGNDALVVADDNK